MTPEITFTATPIFSETVTATNTAVVTPTRWKPTDEHGNPIETLPVAGGAEYLRMRQTLIAIFAAIMMISALILVIHSIRLLLKGR